MLKQQLRQIRKQQKITQDEVAGFLDVKRQTYSAYERGVSVPDSHTLKKLADYFGVSVNYFFDDISATHTLQEKKLLMLSRRAEKIPQAQRERIIKNFEENIDIYLKAMGMDSEDDK